MLLLNSEVRHVLLSHSSATTQPSKEIFSSWGDLLASSAHENNP